MNPQHYRVHLMVPYFTQDRTPILTYIALDKEGKIPPLAAGASDAYRWQRRWAIHLVCFDTLATVLVRGRMGVQDTIEPAKLTDIDIDLDYFEDPDCHCIHECDEHGVITVDQDIYGNEIDGLRIRREFVLWRPGMGYVWSQQPADEPAVPDHG